MEKEMKITLPNSDDQDVGMVTYICGNGGEWWMVPPSTTTSIKIKQSPIKKKTKKTITKHHQLTVQNLWNQILKVVPKDVSSNY